jgi:hypothetical protein
VAFVRRLLPALLATAFVWASLGLAPALVEAGEITIFASKSAPAATWGTGQGALLSMGLMKVLLLEVEGARGLTDSGDTRMTYFTCGAALKAPLTKVTPFAGVGAGLYYQTQAQDWKLNALDSYYVGVKARLYDLIVLRAEYRHFVLRGSPYQTLDSRLSAGAGIAF